MWGLLAAAALTYGLVRAAVAEPAHKRARKLSQLMRLCAVPRERLTLAQAEDGSVLARHLGRRDLASTFEQDVRKLRKLRKKAEPPDVR
jgi:hypothetical protein